jgi:ribosome-associated protein
MSRPDPNRPLVERPNKSQLKRDMEALQELGEALCQLSRDRLAKVQMSDRLRDAVEEYQRVGKHEAKRRHLQYIGKIMRDEDPAPIREALEAFAGTSRAEIARQHKLERLRERLLETEDVLGEIGAEFPGADLQHLRNLRRNALKERDAQKPPRSYREIFQVLRQLSGAAASTEDAAEDAADEGDEE